MSFTIRTRSPPDKDPIFNKIKQQVQTKGLGAIVILGKPSIKQSLEAIPTRIYGMMRKKLIDNHIQGKPALNTVWPRSYSQPNWLITDTNTNKILAVGKLGDDHLHFLVQIKPVLTSGHQGMVLESATILGELKDANEKYGFPWKYDIEQSAADLSPPFAVGGKGKGGCKSSTRPQ